MALNELNDVACGNSDIVDVQSEPVENTALGTQPQPDEAADEDLTCHFWRLPQELLDIVFDMAYGTESLRPIVTKNGYTRVEADRVRSGGHSYAPQPFPAPKVNDFLVCKAFFLHAARAWFAVQSWAAGPKISSSLFKSGLYYEFGGVCNTEPGRTSVHAVAACRRLRDARITMKVEAFDELTPRKFAWIDELGAEDFERLTFTQELKRVRGLRRLVVRAGSSSYTRLMERDRMWHRNVAALRDHIWTWAGLPRGDEDVVGTGGGPWPLYEGSRVCRDRAQILPEDYYVERGKRGGRFVVAEKYKDGVEVAPPPPTTWEKLRERSSMSPQEVWKLIEAAEKKKGGAQQEGTTKAWTPGEPGALVDG